MAIPPGTEFDARARRQLGLTALGVFGPCVWLLDLTAIYAVSSHECDAPRASWALAIAGITLTGIALAFSAALHKRPHDRQHKFQLELALMLNALAFLLVLGFVAPLAVLRPCE